MKHYCPDCSSTYNRSSWNEADEDDDEEWLECLECGKKGPADTFPTDISDGYWDQIDDRVHEYINEIDN